MSQYENAPLEPIFRDSAGHPQAKGGYINVQHIIEGEGPASPLWLTDERILYDLEGALEALIRGMVGGGVPCMPLPVILLGESWMFLVPPGKPLTANGRSATQTGVAVLRLTPDRKVLVILIGGDTDEAAADLERAADNIIRALTDGPF